MYNVNKIESEVKEFVESLGINVHMESRIRDVEFGAHKIKGIYLADDTYIEGDVFIETTGTTGPMGNCLRYGKGCAMCILRCPSFGPRISISERCGVSDTQGEGAEDVLGAMSGSCKLAKESLSDGILKELEEKGVVILKVPREDVNYDKLGTKVCQQYALKEFAENLILLDTGNVKLMTTYYPLNKLRKIKGLEHAKYIDPYAGSKGNSIRYLSVAPRTNDMKVIGVDNLFCAGEKSGLFVGHTEAIGTGALAGHNAVRLAMGMPLLILPNSITVGDIISYENEKSKTREGRRNRYTFAGAGYFKRMQELGLYTMDIKEIENRISKLNLNGIFDQKLC
ncbi:Glucose inhibited division protein A [Clostridium vincentii]|uniref:Glucose inhibited division protein A n=1 Tax=Clostridium vincentii TaxID=52704 RepID=A0A2T0BAJ3_9CLOT|nr:Glucose inhibited division protein A [Clostridium vincentii]